jgi:hypothetical protein
VPPAAIGTRKYIYTLDVHSCFLITYAVGALASSTGVWVPVVGAVFLRWSRLWTANAPRDNRGVLTDSKEKCDHLGVYAGNDQVKKCHDWDTHQRQYHENARLEYQANKENQSGEENQSHKDGVYQLEKSQRDETREAEIKKSREEIFAF